MSRIRSSVPIYAYPAPRGLAWRCSAAWKPSPSTRRRCRRKVSQAAVDELLKRGVVTKGDWVILTKGDSYTAQGGTNTMKVLHVGDLLV